MEYTALSDIGLKRDKNEDSWNIILGDAGVPVGFVVADGMGGYIAGEEASRIAVEEVSDLVLQCISQPALQKMKELINKRIEAVNARIMDYSIAQLGGLKSGTTLSMGIIKNGVMHMAHIGDSRIYLVRDDKVRLITQDHTYVAELVRSGHISADQAQSHPDKNKITRALGFKDHYLPDFYKESIMPGDVFVFCTDGLYEHLEDHELLETVRSLVPQDAARRLIELANERGGNDNSTVIIARM